MKRANEMSEKQLEAEQRLAEIQKRWADIPLMDRGTSDTGKKCEAYLYEKKFPHKLIATMADLYDMPRLNALAKSKDDVDYLLSLLQQPASSEHCDVSVTGKHRVDYYCKDCGQQFPPCGFPVTGPSKEPLPLEFVCIAKNETAHVMRYLLTGVDNNDQIAYLHLHLCECCTELAEMMRGVGVTGGRVTQSVYVSEHTFNVRCNACGLEQVMPLQCPREEGQLLPSGARDIWDLLNKRRHELIDAKRNQGFLEGRDDADFDALQRVAGLVRELLTPPLPEYYEVSCPDCVEGKITAGCAIDKPLISVDCGRCKGTGRVSLPTINLPFSMEDIRRRVSSSAPTPVQPVAATQDDGWVTFGRVKVDIENETETFERIHPPQPSTPTPGEAAREMARCQKCGHRFCKLCMVSCCECDADLPLEARNIASYGRMEAAAKAIVDEVWGEAMKLAQSFVDANIRNYNDHKGVESLERVYDAKRDTAQQIVNQMKNFNEARWHKPKSVIEILSRHFPPTETAQVAVEARDDTEPNVGKFLATIADGLRHAIRDHGPITKEQIGSAAKRVWGRVRETKYDPFRAASKARANAIRECRDLIESKQVEWERLGDYGVSRGYVYRIKGSNEILAALELLAKEGNRERR